MRRSLALAIIGLSAGILVVISCRRSDILTVMIDVPQMSDAKSIRIVTNATLEEVVGQYDGMRNGYEIDLLKKIVLYHESQRLLSPEYQRWIETRIAEVGFNARVTNAGWNPPAPVWTMDGPVQMQKWDDRFTAVISVPEMASNTDANIVVDAIAYARLGGDHPRVSARPDSRRVVATYESLHLSLRNIEYAIACAGFDANAVRANLGAEDAIPHGWTPVTLQVSGKGKLNKALKDIDA